MANTYGGAGEWFGFGGTAAGVGAAFIGFSTGTNAWSGLTWIGSGIAVVGLLVCAFGIRVWRLNVRNARADEEARDVGAASGDVNQSEPTQRIRPALTEYYRETAVENPLAAILKAYLAIEGWYDQALEDHGIGRFDGTRKRSVREMSRLAVERGLLPSSTVATIDGLGVLRDLAVDRQGENITKEEAQHYLTIAEGALLSLDSSLKPAD